MNGNATWTNIIVIILLKIQESFAEEYNPKTQ